MGLLLAYTVSAQPLAHAAPLLAVTLASLPHLLHASKALTLLLKAHGDIDANC